MHAEDLLVHNSRHREMIEAARERLPQLHRVATLALVIEPIYPIDRRALVVATKEEEVLRIPLRCSKRPAYSVSTWSYFASTRFGLLEHRNYYSIVSGGVRFNHKQTNLS